PVELRLRNAMREGDAALPTGQQVAGPVPVAELLERLRALPLPPAGGDGETRRGVGYAVGIKNIGFSEGFDDYSTARVRLAVRAGVRAVEVRTAAAEVGQGLVTVCAQVAATELGVADVTVREADTSVGSAGSSSASRQTYCTGGAVREASRAVREQVLALCVERLGQAGDVAQRQGRGVHGQAEALGDTVVEETRVFRHRATSPLDPETGQ